MRLAVYDNIPYVWLSDGHYYMEAHFTKDAINEFRKIYSTQKFSSLRSKMLLVTHWKLISRQVDSL